MALGVIVAWIWILVGVLVSSFGIRLAYRRERPAAAYVYVGGLLLLAASVFEVHPALVRYNLPRDIRLLQDGLSETEHRLADEQARLLSAKAQLRSSEEAGAATLKNLAANKAATDDCLAGRENEANRNKFLQSRVDQYREQLESIGKRLSAESVSNKTLTNRIETIRSELQQALQIYQTQKELLTANVRQVLILEDEKAALEKDLSAKDQQLVRAMDLAVQLKGQIANSKALEPSVRAGKDQVAGLGEKVRFTPNNSSALAIQKLENSEIVQGEVGDYYLISLKDAKTGSPITFPPAQFVIREKTNELSAALDELRKSVLQRIPADWRYRLFVRGQADGGSFREPIVQEDFRNLEYLPPRDASGTRYEARMIRKRLHREFENEDLPNLRGAFMARTLQKTAKLEAPVLLGNTPQPGVNAGNRRADIILLIKRPAS